LIRIHFTYLNAYSSNGGIQRYNKCLIKVLEALEKEGKSSVCLNSLSDTEINSDIPSKKGFGGNKFLFLLSSIVSLFKSDVLILGHINLSVLLLVSKLFNPKQKTILITHGIEVWGKLSFIQRKALATADKVFTVSRFTKEKIQESHHFLTDRISIIHNTLDPEYIVPGIFEKPTWLIEKYGLGEATVLMTVCRLSKSEVQKGYDKVIRVLTSIIASGKNVKYILVGKFDKEEKERLDALIMANDLQNHVILAGPVSDSELMAHYLSADVFVMPSQKEGFGIVFIEALLCGLTVVAGNKDGSRDALRDGELGILVDAVEDEDILKGIEAGMGKSSRMTIADKKNQQKKVIQYFGFENFKKRVEEEMFF
jgi:phosphatidyl-myo-inositol dimannoside synthase